MAPRSPQWVNTPVLLEALDRYEQGRLPRTMRLWLEAVLEIEAPVSAPLRPHCAVLNVPPTSLSCQM